MSRFVNKLNHIVFYKYIGHVIVLGRLGGGVAIYVKNGHHVVHWNDLEVLGVECVWVEFKNHPVLIGTFHRPPDSLNYTFDLIEHSGQWYRTFTLGNGWPTWIRSMTFGSVDEIKSIHELEFSVKWVSSLIRKCPISLSYIWYI
jgi:hypothetical protein